MNKKIIWIQVTVVFLPVLFIGYFWGDLPDELPRHYNLKGEPDAYWPKEFIFVLPLVNACLAAFLYAIPKLDPRGENFGQFRRTYDIIQIAVTSFFSAFILFQLYSVLGFEVFAGLRLLSGIEYLMIALLFLLAYYLGKVKPNYFVDVRTPWTLENEEVWKRTHQFSRKLFLAIAILLLLLKIVISPEYFLLILSGVTFVGALIALVYSYAIYGKLRAATK